MPNSPYTPPGVRVQEILSPSFSPLLDRPTSIAIIGEAQGFLAYTETLLLSDNTAVALRQTGVDLTTLVVKDALNPLVTYSGQDYSVTTNSSTGVTSIKRNLYTTIPDGQGVVAVASTTSPTGVISIPTTLNGATSTGTLTPSNGGNVNSVVVQSRGQFTAARDFNTTVTSNTAVIARKTSGSAIVDGQTVYVAYTRNSGATTYVDTLVLPGTSAVHLLTETSVDGSSIRVFNANPATDASLNGNVAAVTIYTAGATNDYVISSLPGTTFTLQRSTSGPTTLGLSSNRGQVKLSYQATPLDYYQPVRVSNPSDVESRFGSSIDASGNVNSPISFAAIIAFANGATDLVLQPLFHATDGTLNGVRVRPVYDNKTTYLSDWATSLSALRDLEDVNIIVPAISFQNVASLTDGDVLNILQRVASHINYMDQNDQYVIGLYGEDSTNGLRATDIVLQSHASTLAAGLFPERQVLVNQGSLDFPSPLGGSPIAVGGQYLAAAIAGGLAGRAIQIPATRKSIVGFSDVRDYRSKLDKLNDAASGLLVVEKVNGVVQVRHAITTAVADPNTRELSVIRSKHFMLESIRKTLDTQVVGQIVVDNRAPFVVATAIQGVLETLLSQGVIVGYSGLGARSLAPTNPSKIEARFSWRPAYPLNNIDIIFSLDATEGTTTVVQA